MTPWRLPAEARYNGLVIVECSHCGAPLDVERGSAFARCSYCGKTNKVKSAKTLMAESPVAWKPPPVWQPPPHVPARSAAPLPYRPQPAQRGSALPAVFAGLVLLLGSGFALWTSGALTEVPYLGLALDGEPLLDTFDLDARSSPPPSSGVAVGRHQASGLAPECRGYLPRRPHLVLRTRGPTAVRLDVDGSAVDLVMAVRTSEGEWLCDDDSGGNRMPRFVGTLPAGEHRVWVGTYSSDESSAFALRVSASPSAASGPIVTGLAPESVPSIGTLVTGPERIEGSWTGTASGWVEADTVDPSCRGWLPVVPHMTVTTTEGRTIELATRENQGLDLVMALRPPSGRFQCDDDSGGSLNPRIVTTLEPGTTVVWVGVYQQGRTGAFALDVREQAERRASAHPAAVAPTLGTVNLDRGDAPRRFEGSTGSNTPIRSVGSRCPGFVGASHDLVLATTIPRPLTLRARGGTDLRLVARGPDGQVRCVEASGAAEATLSDTLAPGVHHVWIGTARRRSSRYELVLE